MHIPIVFSIDKNVVVPCGVTITSLLLNAREDTQYVIYILGDESRLPMSERHRLLHAFADKHKCEIHFVDVGDSFMETDGMTSGHITRATYYRLVIPDIFPQYDKVLYADIDMIFQQDLSAVFQHSLNNDELIAAARDLAFNDEFYFPSEMPYKIGKTERDYFNAGFLVMNLKLMREERIVDLFREHAKIKYDQNDQDILNIVCNSRAQILPSIYNFQLNHFANYMWGRESSDFQFADLFKKATLHYTGKHKPWNSLECVGYDTWWHYYKMSPFYDDNFYFKRQFIQIEACRNDYHNKTNSQLFRRILVNLKHKFIG